MSKLSTSEMLRLALIYAARDRESYLDAIENVKHLPEYKQEYADNEALLKQIREYRIKRFGRFVPDRERENPSPVVSIQEPVRTYEHGKEAS